MKEPFTFILLFSIASVYSQELFPATIDWSTKTEQSWDNTDWSNEAQTQNYFDLQGRLSSQVFEWGSQLTPMNGYTYYYNSTDRPDSILDQFYDSPNLRWVNYILFSFAWSTSSLTLTYNYYDTVIATKLVRYIVFDSLYNITNDSSCLVNRKTGSAKPYMRTVASYSDTAKVFDEYKYDTVKDEWSRSRSTVDSIFLNANGRDSAVFIFSYGIINPAFPPNPNSKWGLLSQSRSYAGYENGKLSVVSIQLMNTDDSTWKTTSRQVFSYAANSARPVLHAKELHRVKQSSWAIVPSVGPHAPAAYRDAYFDLKGRKFISQQCFPLPGQVQIQGMH